MEFYSFNDNKLQRKSYYDNNIYDIFKTTLKDEKLRSLVKYSYTIPIEFEGRLDRICEFLYDDNKYIEELMLINNILNMYSVKAGDTILYVSLDDLESLHSDTEESTDKVDVLNINNPKTADKDVNRTNIVLPPVVKDSSSKQLSWNKDNKSVTINNKIN